MSEDDLVARLRKEAERQRQQRGDMMTYGESDPWLLEAAAELSRLREGVATCNDSLQVQIAQARRQVWEEAAGIAQAEVGGWGEWSDADAVADKIASALRSRAAGEAPSPVRG